MDKSFLVRLLGFGATLIHGDTLVLDRWRWLKKRLPTTCNLETLLDVGCGTGAFTIGAARRGYHSIGISWDERNQRVAIERASLCGADTAGFVVGDVRQLEMQNDVSDRFDVVICLECIEHILDDQKLMNDMADRLKPGGRLLLTTPYYLYRAMDSGDLGPFAREEDGGHVRRGYSSAMLLELCSHAGLSLPEITYCSGYLSQKTTAIMRRVNRLFGGSGVSWIITSPLRLVPWMLPDRLLTKTIDYPFYSICLEAYKPRVQAGALVSSKGLLEN